MKYIFYEYQKDRTDKIFAEKQVEHIGKEHFHRAFEIAYMISGSATYFIEGKRVDAEANDIVFSHCYYRHVSADSVPNKKFVIAVPEKLTRDIYSCFKDNTLPVLLSDKEFNKNLYPYFEKLVSGGQELSSMLSKGYANLIFGELSAHYDSTPVIKRDKGVSFITDIIEYIDMHYKETISLDTLASHFCYNKAYFSRFFNHHIGTSLNNYVNSVRYEAFLRMKEIHPDKDITELALSCGFPSMPTFYRTHKIYMEYKARKTK